MSGKSRWKRGNLWGIIFCIVFVLAAIMPYYRAYVLEPVSFDQQVEPAFMNGLLTASSILFGFSSLLIVRQESVDFWAWMVLLLPLGFIFASGTAMSGLALGKRNSVAVLLLLTASFQVNVICTIFLVGCRTAALIRRDTRKM